MSKGMWAVAAVVAAVLIALFVADPLGIFGKSGSEKDDGDGSGDAALDLGAGLEGRGDGRAAGKPLTSFEGDAVGSVDLGLGQGVLTGKVLGDGQPLYLARVRPVLPPEVTTLAVRTRENGTYEIRGLPLGQHDIRVTHPEFVAETVVAPLLAAAPPAGDGAADATASTGPVEGVVPTVDLGRRRDSTNSIVIQVLDVLGRPLPGAKVLATTVPWAIHLAMGPEAMGIREYRSKQGVTDEAGVCRLSNLEPDKYDVAVVKKGYVARAIEHVQVAENRSRKLSMRLEEGQSIRGRVSDAAGGGVAGAIVMGFHMPSFNSSLNAMTDANGDFVLTGLRKGSYTLMAFHDEYGQVQAQATSPGQGLSMKLGGTGTIDVTVKWADGTPVTEATVRPFAAQMGFGYVYSFIEKLEDPNGKTQLVLPNGNYLVRVQTPDGTLSSDVKADVTVGETTSIDITMPPTGVVRGVIVNAAGEHIAGAEVYIRRGGFPPHKSREQYARTNADGEFEVTGLSLETVKLRVEHTEYADTELATEAKPAKSAPEVTVRMAKGASVSGHVRDAEGQPIPNRQVTIYQNWFEPFVTHTDPNGYYVFTSVREGTWAVKEGPFENQAPGVTKPGIAVPAEGSVTVDFELDTSTGSVTGVVELAGKPVSGATVTIFSDATAAPMVSATTNEEGRFEAAGVAIADFRVYVNTADNLTASARGTFAEGQKTTDIKVEMGQAGLKGRIVRTEGGPLSGAWITVETVEAGDSFDRTKGWKSSQTDGTFEFGGLSKGRYQLRISHPEYAQLLTDPITISAEGVSDLGDIKLAPGAVLSGRVVDDKGTPVEDATVSLTDSGGRPVFLFSFSTTGSDGRYSVQGLETGRYTVKIEAKGYSPFQGPVNLEAGGATLDGTLTRGGRVAITVTDDGGYPIAGAVITLFDAAGKRVERTLSLANLFDGQTNRTDDKGIATLSDLAAGTYRAKVEHSGYQAEGASTSVSIRPGETTKTTVSLVAK